MRTTRIGMIVLGSAAVTLVFLVTAGCGGGGGNADPTLTEGSIAPGQIYAAPDEDGGKLGVFKTRAVV